MNIEYQSWLAEYDRMVNINSYFGNIKIFNDNYLTLKEQGRVRAYHFPKLNLEVLGLRDDNILEYNRAHLTYEHLRAVKFWVRDWMINGNQSPLAKH